MKKGTLYVTVLFRGIVGRKRSPLLLSSSELSRASAAAATAEQTAKLASSRHLASELLLRHNVPTFLLNSRLQGRATVNRHPPVCSMKDE
jgi:hypothetical protein